GLIAHYKTEREGAERLENLNELVTAAAVFASEENYEGLPAGRVPDLGPDVPSDGLTPLAAFLAHAAPEAGDNQAQAGQDAVQLMTAHAAKGPELDAVFSTGRVEGPVPQQHSTPAPAGLAPARRLMYVAIPPARQRLYLSQPQRRMLHGQPRCAMRSRLLDELPGQHVEWLTPGVGSLAARSG